MTQEQKNKNRIVAASMTAGITGLLLLLVIMIVWGEPNPPLEGRDGVELNFGLDNEGFGDVQPTEPVGSEEKAAEPQRTETQPVKVEAPQPEPEPEKPSEQLTSDDEESPAIVKEKEKEKKKEEKKEPEKQVEKVVTQPKKEQPVAATEPKKVNPNAVYDPTASKSGDNSSSNAGKAGKPGNHGDDPGKTGDKGNPQGSLDSKALYGNPGSGGDGGGGSGGSSLDLSGWTWDAKPSPKVPNNESGRLEFEIKVDENGDIISIKTLQKSVSAEAEQICRKAVEKLTFSKIGSSVPSVSTGRITFVIRAQ